VIAKATSTPRAKLTAKAQVDGWKKAFDESVNAERKQPNTLEPDTEPVLLSTLATLLNYERCVSDSRFKGVKLLHSTFAEPLLTD
jgi:hypothetical protein